MASEASKTANKKYKKEKTKNVNIRFYLNTDQELLTYLEKQPNKQGYIKKLIRDDMNK